MELLKNPEDRGYPVEYLLSRLRGRRANLIREWKKLLYEPAIFDHLSSAQYKGFVYDRTPEGLWRNLLKEYGWVYSEMNRQLREIFKPFFFYTELRTLFICLRQLKEQKPAHMDELLLTSLLSDNIKTVLKTSPGPGEGVAGLEELLGPLLKAFQGLTAVFDTEGLRGVEQRVTNAYLVHVSGTKLYPVLQAFFSHVIDARNIMSLYKAIRLNMKAMPVFITGGTIAQERCSAILSKGDMFEVIALIRKTTGLKIDSPDMTRVETALYRWTTRFLKKEARDPLGLGLILDYLWRCSLEAMNLGVLLHGRELERELVEAELIV